MGKTSRITLRRLERFWENAKLYVNEAVSGLSPESQKEIIKVLTYSAQAPESPENGNLYISTNNLLWEYSNGEWTSETPSQDVVYVTSDTSHMYLYNGTEFRDVTGEKVDDTIYVNNLNSDLAEYTDDGVCNVCYTEYLGSTQYYVFTITTKKGPNRVGKGSKIYNVQTLRDAQGFMTRSKESTSQQWSTWVEYMYMYEQDKLSEEEIDAICV